MSRQPISLSPVLHDIAEATASIAIVCFILLAHWDHRWILLAWPGVPVGKFVLHTVTRDLIVDAAKDLVWEALIWSVGLVVLAFGASLATAILIAAFWPGLAWIRHHTGLGQWGRP